MREKGLTLIQSQVLESLVEAIGSDSSRRDHGVGVAAVQERLRARRPRRQSDRYVARILNELVDRTIDGRQIVERRRSRPVRWVAFNAAFEYVAGRS